MLLSQSDLFYGVHHLFLGDVMAIAGREALDSGARLFEEDEAAEFFYILIDGCVRLSIHDSLREIYICAKTGEMIGCSSIMGGECYSATAVCTEPTRLLKIRSRDFLALLDKDPDSKLLFFQHLAQCLGQRLLHSHQAIST